MTPSECRDYLGRLQHFGIKLGLENITTLLRWPWATRRTASSPSTSPGRTARARSRPSWPGSCGRTGSGPASTPRRTSPGSRSASASTGGASRRARFRELLARLKAVIDGLMAEGRLAYHPTYFEVLTALAFLEFAERPVDIAVLEVGLGGRFDATNVVRPLVSVITTIAKDHEKHLGSTLEKIAFEKAGIIKPRIPVVCGVRGGAALREIRRVARERQAPLTEALRERPDARDAAGRRRLPLRLYGRARPLRFLARPGRPSPGRERRDRHRRDRGPVARLEAFRQVQGPRSHPGDPLGGPS